MPSPNLSASPPNGRGLLRRRWAWLAVLIVLIIGGAGGLYWWLHRPPALPPGIVFSNGRLEADEIDVATKFSGRISQILADEGDVVKAGQVVARIDTRDLQAQEAQAEAQVLEAEHTITQNRALLAEQRSQRTLAEQELRRARNLVAEQAGTREQLDQRQQQFDTAAAAYNATDAQIAAATAAMQAAQHNADLIRVNIADDTLIAPREGPIQYRLANTGEVLASGGKVFTMLDGSYVYMDIFLPTGSAGKVKLGDDARIVLDAMPDRPIPAKVTFVASKNQFTPKSVETQSERDTLMFRVRVRINSRSLDRGDIRSGQPGLTYVRLDAKTAWPPALQAGAAH